MFSLALFAIAAPFVVSAQQVHQVVVGSSSGALAFSPEAIFASPGDTVTFQFQQKNHSVVRSSFADPCGPVAGGFNSGFMPVPPGQTSNFPEYNITVTDSKPIWVYCAQQAPVSHCHQGMVFAVNCGATGSANSFDSFKASAIAQGASASSSAAAAPSYAAPSSAAPSAAAAPSATDAAPSSSITIPPAPPISTVTAAVTVASSTWTTTYGSYPNSPAPTPASLTGNVIKVVVGGNSTLTFSPSFVQALPRDTIVFEFQTKNHSATQSSFASPCQHLNNATSGQVGFDSGFMPVPAGATSFPTWNVTVNDTSPVWVYCKQTGHCGAGMVLSINSDESSARSSAAFTALAKQINGTSNVASASTPSNSTTSNSTTSNSTTSSSPSASQPGGAIRSAASLKTLGFIALVGGLMAML